MALGPRKFTGASVQNPAEFRFPREGTLSQVAGFRTRTSLRPSGWPRPGAEREEGCWASRALEGGLGGSGSCRCQPSPGQEGTWLHGVTCCTVYFCGKGHTWVLESAELGGSRLQSILN